MFHETYSPVILNPDSHYSGWRQYRFNATFYLNGKGYRADGVTPFPKVSLTAPAEG